MVVERPAIAGDGPGSLSACGERQFVAVECRLKGIETGLLRRDRLDVRLFGLMGANEGLYGRGMKFDGSDNRITLADIGGLRAGSRGRRSAGPELGNVGLQDRGLGGTNGRSRSGSRQHRRRHHHGLRQWSQQGRGELGADLLHHVRILIGSMPEPTLRRHDWPVGVGRVQLEDRPATLETQVAHLLARGRFRGRARDSRWPGSRQLLARLSLAGGRLRWLRPGSHCRSRHRGRPGRRMHMQDLGQAGRVGRCVRAGKPHVSVLLHNCAQLEINCVEIQIAIGAVLHDGLGEVH